VHRAFDGDLVAALVLATIANRNLHRYYEEVVKTSGTGLDELVANGDHLTALRHCNAFSVSSATGVPKETVRRKVKSLESKGWIEVAARGELFIARDIAAQFQDFDSQTIARFLTTARDALAVVDSVAKSGRSGTRGPPEPG
jgi:DNA-binding transcriptional regulator YhcF (GntR family)